MVIAHLKDAILPSNLAILDFLTKEVIGTNAISGLLCF